MTPEFYQKAMAELGVRRAGFESGIDATPSGSQLTPNKQRVLLKPRSSTVPDKLPMEPVPEHLQCVHPRNKTARAWWAGLSPEERKEQSQKRSENAKKQGRKALRMYGAP